MFSPALRGIRALDLEIPFTAWFKHFFANLRTILFVSAYLASEIFPEFEKIVKIVKIPLDRE